MSDRFKLLLLIICLGMVLFLWTSLFHISNNGKYEAKGSLEQTTKVKKPYVLYLAKDTCPQCKELDEKMNSSITKLKFPVYRIEISSEKNQFLAKKIIQENNIKEVPAFVLVREKETKKVTEKNIFFD